MTCHHHWVIPTFHPIMMNVCPLNEAPCLECLFGLTQDLKWNSYMLGSLAPLEKVLNSCHTLFLQEPDQTNTAEARHATYTESSHLHFFRKEYVPLRQLISRNWCYRERIPEVMLS